MARRVRTWFDSSGTNIEIKAFKPQAKPYRCADAGGLFLLIQPNGAKIWHFAYRFDGKQKLLSGGPYPHTTLLAARAWRDVMKHQLALCLDPSEERRHERQTTTGRVVNSFEDVAREWLEIRRLSCGPRYAALVAGRLDADIFPVIGKLDIGSIAPRDILSAIRNIEARGAIEMARRVKSKRPA